MPGFRYTAVSATGELERGWMEAPDQAAVIERLQRKGRIPISASPAGGAGFLSDLLSANFSLRRDRLSTAELAEITRELATMLAAGQDLDRALRFIVESTDKSRVRTIIDRLRAKVRGGATLAASLQQEEASFPRLYIGLVRAGEAGGALAETLDRLALLLERERKMAAGVQSAMIYPALLMLAAIGSIALLLTHVLPQFLPLFKQGGAQLPSSAQFLVDLGDAIPVALPWLLGAAVLGVPAAGAALRNPATRLRVDTLLLRLPVAGALARQTLAARFGRTLGTLLKNGVPLIAALGIAKEAVGNSALAAAIDRATASAKAGRGLSQPLGEARILPLRTIHLLRLGEETAQLPQMALRAADIHEEEARIALERLVALLVPSITIAMGAAVAGIVGTLLMAMMSLNDLAN
jgi:general secretion pathway protein F